MEWDTPAPNNSIMKNLNAYWAKDGIALDVHISQTNPPDNKVMLAVLKQIEVGEMPAVVRFLKPGVEAYDTQNYPKAIEYLQQALNEENRKRTLNRIGWHALNVYLGLSYYYCKDFKTAKKIFEDALAQDNGYPLFYYNLACCYAEMGNLPEALKYLEKTYETRMNLDPGLCLHDPAEDTSFAKYLNDPKFQETAKKFKNINQ